MAASSLLALLDDIATLLDDVAVLSKVAAKKTVGVLGDDLALNAQQVSGVKANRELPVVWAVAKGSFLNKCILVPAALVISVFLPALIIVLLMLGGLFLCFEGVEKLAHKFFESKEQKEANHQEKLKAIQDKKVDLVALEKKKIKGAIRTDFILSAEIIVISLGAIQSAPFLEQVLTISALAVMITVGVYGLVAGIVKLDDAGLYLVNKAQAASEKSVVTKLQESIGFGVLAFAPFLMKSLSVLGTLAMFMVGGGILVHGIPGGEAWLHHAAESMMGSLASSESVISIGSMVVQTVGTAIFGVLAGALTLILVQFGFKLAGKEMH
ncbi:DUF808 domain-containing protein [Litoribacillus peritrichatus]|uniref:DUF808 domain-containing protein n=1 Tax=Litoribacillus peritrichatus TaxID=718191 RepID=A0ABP7N6W5_9GAMM